MSYKLFSPAKINLFLRVLGKRPDGYHELASLFQAVSVGDELTLTPAKSDQFTCTTASVPCDRSNLVLRALELFRQKTGFTLPLHLHLEKRLPLEAGLGGGSSNAATLLWGLKSLSGLPLSEEELASWGAELGADVPFFFSRGTTYCRGIGEILRPLPFRAQQFLLAKPHGGLSTGAIFRALDLKRCHREDPELLLEEFLAGKPRYLNDLEEPACALMPSLRPFKESLTFPEVGMTGSGSCFFCSGEGSLPASAVYSERVSAIYREEGSWWSR